MLFRLGYYLSVIMPSKEEKLSQLELQSFMPSTPSAVCPRRVLFRSTSSACVFLFATEFILSNPFVDSISPFFFWHIFLSRLTLSTSNFPLSVSSPLPQLLYYLVSFLPPCSILRARSMYISILLLTPSCLPFHFLPPELIAL